MRTLSDGARSRGRRANAEDTTSSSGGGFLLLLPTRLDLLLLLLAELLAELDQLEQFCPDEVEHLAVIWVLLAHILVKHALHLLR